ncbi:hypothetical protein KI387_007200, partial [Taxus chinensis]
MRLREHTLQLHSRPYSTSLIISVFTVLPLARGTKRQWATSSAFDSRSLHPRDNTHSSPSHHLHVVEPSDKSVEIMRKFSEKYASRSGTYFCVDKGVTSVVIKGLAEHKDTLGAPLCPCRHYDDKVAEAQQGFWNCPCVPMRE